MSNLFKDCRDHPIYGIILFILFIDFVALTIRLFTTQKIKEELILKYVLILLLLTPPIIFHIANRVGNKLKWD